MADVKKVKKEFLENCAKFKTFFGNNPISKDIRQALDINKALFQDLQIIAKEGSESDKKEAFEEFAEIAKAFSSIYKHITEPLKDIPNFNTSIDVNALIKSGKIDLEKIKMMQKLGKDFERLTQGPTKNGG